jgi:mRNA interferase RelE/StbE
MDRFRVIVVRAAARELESLPEHVQERFGRVFDRLQEDPFRARPGVDVLKMQGGTYRVHVGRYRGIFRISGSDVVFLRFGHRSTVYR